MDLGLIDVLPWRWEGAVNGESVDLSGRRGPSGNLL